MSNKDTTNPVVIEANPGTETVEGEAYPDGLLPWWKNEDDRELGRNCTPIDVRMERAAMSDRPYGKRVNIGLLVSIEGLRDLLASHGVDALELFIAEATRDFEQRLRVAIADTDISVEFRDSIDVYQEQTGFDLMRRVYGIANADPLDGDIEADLETDGKSSWRGVPGYYWNFASGGIDAELVKAEAEGGLEAVMQRISEIVGESS